jgi:hypothetical protein
MTGPAIAMPRCRIHLRAMSTTPAAEPRHRTDRAPGHRLRGSAADRVIEEIAARQHGLVSRVQLLEAGIPAQTIDRRVANGRLRVLHRGVYQVGPVAAPRGREMAAVLACGGNAAVSHFTAAWVHGVRPRRGPSEPVHVILTAGHCGVRAGIRAYRRRIEGDEIVVIDRLPVTTPARMLLDLAPLLGRRQLEKLFATAERTGIVTRDAVRSLLLRYPLARGGARLRELVMPEAEFAFTRSRGEEVVVAMVAGAGLPAPIINGYVLGFEVDLHWPDYRFILEFDGYAFHSGRAEFDGDRSRDRVLQNGGWQVLRVTWRHLRHERDAVLVAIAKALARPVPRGGA